MLLLSKVTQKHFRQPYRPSKVPLCPAGLFLPLFGFLLHHYSHRLSPVFLPAHIPDLHSTVFPPDTILLPDSSPFLSVPTYHQPELPDFLRSESLYQSINLMIINHICHCCCYILIFPISLYLSPFTTIKFATNLQTINQLPATPYWLSPCLLSTGA